MSPLINSAHLSPNFVYIPVVAHLSLRPLCTSDYRQQLPPFSKRLSGTIDSQIPLTFENVYHHRCSMDGSIASEPQKRTLRHNSTQSLPLNYNLQHNITTLQLTTTTTTTTTVLIKL